MENYTEILMCKESDTDMVRKAYLNDKKAQKLCQTGEFEKARNLLFKELENEQLFYEEKLICRIYSTIGISYCRQTDFIPAEDYFNKALELAINQQDKKLLLSCYMNLGNYEGIKNNIVASLNYFYEALKYSSELEHTQIVSKLYNNIGIALTSINEYKDALYYLKLSLKIQCKLKTQVDIGHTCLNIGNIYYYTEEYSLAFAYFKRVIKIFKEQNNYHLFIAYMNMSMICNLRNKDDEAIKYSILASELGKFQDNKDLLFQAYAFSLSLFIKNNDKEAIDHYIKLCESLIEKVNEPNFLYSYYSNLSNYFETIEDFKTANLHIRKCLGIIKNLSENDLNKKIAEFKTKIDYEHKIKEADLYKKKSMELENFNNQIEQQKSELIALNKSKDSILNIVSHDLKNSIGAVMPILDLIENEKKDKHLDPFFKMIGKLTQKAMELVHNILDASRIDMQDYKLKLQIENINLLVRSYESLLKTQASIKNIQIEFRYCDFDLKSLLNPPKFYQIIQNLCSNAIKFSYENSIIKIITERSVLESKPYAIISISDSGVGIPSNNLPYLFEKFTRISRKGTNGENSTGLGLSIVKRLVELHGGFIKVQSEVNKGTTFSLHFPIV